VARRFGYTPATVRVMAHQFRNNPQRPFFLPSERQTKPGEQAETLARPGRRPTEAKLVDL